MPCLYCNANFSIIKWKKKCDFCTHQFCTSCIVQKRCLACASILNCQWKYDSLMNVKTKDLKLYLSVRGTPVHLYTEKTELVRLVILKKQFQNNPSSHVDSSGHTVQNPVPTPPAEPHQSGSQSTNVQGSRAADIQHEPAIERPVQRTADQTSQDSHHGRSASRIGVSSTSDDDLRDIQDGESNSTPVTGVERPTPSGLANKIIIADIKSKDQIELLTIRELKQILYDNFINYKGCVEKIELQARVHSLYHDKEKAKQDSERDVSDESNICKICWDETIDCVLLDCGHMATCTSCGKRLNECPICRQFIVRCVHVFRS